MKTLHSLWLDATNDAISQMGFINRYSRIRYVWLSICLKSLVFFLCSSNIIRLILRDLYDRRLSGSLIIFHPSYSIDSNEIYLKRKCFLGILVLNNPVWYDTVNFSTRRDDWKFSSIYYWILLIRSWLWPPLLISQNILSVSNSIRSGYGWEEWRKTEKRNESNAYWIILDPIRIPW